MPEVIQFEKVVEKDFDVPDLKPYLHILLLLQECSRELISSARMPLPQFACLAKTRQTISLESGSGRDRNLYSQ